MGWLDNIKGVIRRVGDFSKPILAGAARFVQKHHQPLALLAKSIADASGNPTAQALGNLAVGASSTYATRQRLNEHNAVAGAARTAAGRPNGVYDASTGRVY